ncbi:MAG: flippase [Promethearchaeota archaeon]
MEELKIVVKNTSSLILSDIGVKILSFFYAMISARYLGVENYGIIGFALALMEILSFFMDYGVCFLAVREMARNKDKLYNYIGNFIFIKIIFVSSAIGVMIPLVFFSTLSQITKGVLYAIITYYSIISFVAILSSFFQAMEKMEYHSLGNFIHHAVILLGSLFGVFFGVSTIQFSFFYVLAAVAFLSYNILITILKFKIKVTVQINKGLFTDILKKSISFGMIRLFTSAYNFINLVLVSLFLGDYDAGIFKVAQYFVIMFNYLIAFIFLSGFPTFSRLFKEGKIEHIRHLSKNLIKYALILASIIIIIVVSYTGFIINLIYGSAFQDSEVILDVFIWNIFLNCLTSLFMYMLYAINKQKQVLFITLIGAIFNTITNLFALHYVGIIGAPFVSIFTSFVMLALYFRQSVPFNRKEIMKISSKVLLSLIPFILIQIFATTLDPSISFAIGLGCFIGFLFITKNLSIAEIKDIIGIFLSIFKKNKESVKNKEMDISLKNNPGIKERQDEKKIDDTGGCLK